jgi:outer membrane protein OmpA-like peptidoglycan-associated protein
LRRRSRRNDPFGFGYCHCCSSWRVFSYGFSFDRLLFSTGSATLQPQSSEQLHNIAAILKAYPNTHLTIGGYTDNTGDAAQNLKLSQDRADSVTAELVKLGVAKDRLLAKGYGEQHPVGDNATEAGRAQNRRISMLVTQK